MRINEEKTYTLYLSESEFELMHPITKSVNYQHVYYKNCNEQNGEYLLKMNEEQLDDVKELLETEQTYQLYEEYNRSKAEEIRDLLNDIYYELNY